MNAIKVTVCAENPVQELGGGEWILEYCGDYVCLANEGASVEIMLTTGQAQIVLDSLQAALTPKEVGGASDTRIESILGVSVKGLEQLLCEYNKSNPTRAASFGSIADWVHKLRLDVHKTEQVSKTYKKQKTHFVIFMKGADGNGI